MQSIASMKLSLICNDRLLNNPMQIKASKAQRQLRTMRIKSVLALRSISLVETVEFVSGEVFGTLVIVLSEDLLINDRSVVYIVVFSIP